MEYARDLGRINVWEESLKRSLERRGRPRRSSVELYRLRPERDLTLGDVLQRSAHYSELRRRAAERSAMPRPTLAVGGISALALVAGAALPSLLTGARDARKEQIANAADTHARARVNEGVAGRRRVTEAAAVTQLEAAELANRVRATRAPAPATRAPAPATRAGRSSASAKPNLQAAVAAAASLPPLVVAVRELQQRLHLDPVDGSFGAVTEQAVKAFQSTHGLAANGIVGDATREALGLGAGPTLRADPALIPVPVITQKPVSTVVRRAPVSTVEHLTAPVSTAGHTTGTAVRPAAPTRTVSAVHTTTPVRSTTGPTSSVQTGLSEMTAAGNQIATRPYVYGGGHGSFYSYGYDCSGSVSYVLHAAGLLSSPEDSTGLESYGAAGPGRYVTIYANAGHAWMTIEGRRFDTVALAETGSRWSSTIASTAGYVVHHPSGY